MSPRIFIACECLIELERFISESSLQGPVLVAGDFNAHFGEQEGQRGSGGKNIQGVMLIELMSRCRLSAVTMGCISQGPSHTYESGNVRTTVDYILADLEASAMLLSCRTQRWLI